MPFVPDPEQFTRALTVYFGDDSDPGYDPVQALDGCDRITMAFREHETDLKVQIDQMFERALGLSGLESLSLNDAMAAIRTFIVSEYSFLPSILQAKVVNCCGYRLWK
jgi:hypothetical protein